MNEKQKEYWQDYQVLKLETWINEFNPEEINVDEIQKYLEFIKESAKNYDPNHYSEWHHVMPRCVDKDHKFDNEGVRINGNEHLDAHLKILQCFNNKRYKGKLVYALAIMKGRINDVSFEKLNKIHEALSLLSSGEGNPFYGRKHSLEVKEHMSKILSIYYSDNDIIWINNKNIELRIRSKDFNLYSQIGFIKGRLPLSEEHKTKLSKSFSGKKNPMYGKTHSPEVRKQISKKVKALPKKMWINNGIITKMIFIGEPIPEGFVEGRGFVKRKD